MPQATPLSTLQDTAPACCHSQCCKSFSSGRIPSQQCHLVKAIMTQTRATRTPTWTAAKQGCPLGTPQGVGCHMPQQVPPLHAPRLMTCKGRAPGGCWGQAGGTETAIRIIPKWKMMARAQAQGCLQASNACLDNDGLVGVSAVSSHFVTPAHPTFSFNLSLGPHIVTVIT